MRPGEEPILTQLSRDDALWLQKLPVSLGDALRGASCANSTCFPFGWCPRRCTSFFAQTKPESHFASSTPRDLREIPGRVSARPLLPAGFVYRKFSLGWSGHQGTRSPKVLAHTL